MHKKFSYKIVVMPDHAFKHAFKQAFFKSVRLQLQDTVYIWDQDTVISQYQHTSTWPQFIDLGIQYGCPEIMQKHSVGNTLRFIHV